MRILIAGAIGAIGRPLVRRLKANHPEVFALTRSPDSAPLKEVGAEPVVADPLDAAAVKAAVERIRPHAVINELTSLPRRYTPTAFWYAPGVDLADESVPFISRASPAVEAGARRYVELEARA